MLLEKLADPRGFEPPASAFGGQRSIQLSYGSAAVLVLTASGGPAQGGSKTCRPRLSQPSTLRACAWYSLRA
jgi:hypothetical protein